MCLRIVLTLECVPAEPVPPSRAGFLTLAVPLSLHWIVFVVFEKIAELVTLYEPVSPRFFPTWFLLDALFEGEC